MRRSLTSRERGLFIEKAVRGRGSLNGNSSDSRWACDSRRSRARGRDTTSLFTPRSDSANGLRRKEREVVEDEQRGERDDGDGKKKRRDRSLELSCTAQ